MIQRSLSGQAADGQEFPDGAGEFSRQARRLVELGYPAAMGMTDEAFLAAIAPLAAKASGLGVRPDIEAGKPPFVLVINSASMPARAMLPLIRRRDRPAIERLHPIELERFTPIQTISLPVAGAYLLVDIDRGASTLNVTPDDSLVSIEASGRSPLTIEEGIALLTHHPEFLQPNACFSLLASRCGDKRVPAFWLSSGQPRLGWCWAGNPHTWLGSASCGARLGA